MNPPRMAAPETYRGPRQAPFLRLMGWKAVL